MAADPATADIETPYMRHGALQSGVGLASHMCMVDATRFQFRLPAAQRAQLETLAEQCGLSSADLTRLALQRLLEDRDVRLPAHETEAAA
jgi:hypothetical protein